MLAFTTYINNNLNDFKKKFLNVFCFRSKIDTLEATGNLQ